MTPPEAATRPLRRLSTRNATIAPSLEVRGLCLTAGGRSPGRALFAGLDLRIDAGQVWAVVGPNGAGKSSLLAALAGVFPVFAGSIELGDRALAEWRADDLADLRAWCPQFWTDPFSASVRETAALAHRRRGGWRDLVDADADGDAVTATLERLALDALAEADVQTLSGGERQRVALATALLQEAPLLLLDEPAAHLDLVHQRLLTSIVREHAAAGGAVAVSVHDLDLAFDLSDHVILLDGRGGARAGARDEMLVATRLSDAFGVAIESIAIGTARRFFVASGA